MPVLARIAWPFWNAEERRLRGGLRIAVTMTANVLVLLGAGALPGLLGRSVGAFAVALGLQALGVIVVTALAAQLLDRRPARVVLGIAPRPRYALDLAFGIVLGGVCMGAIVGVESALGWASYAPRELHADPLVAAVPIGTCVSVFVSVALLEEISFRGYLVPNLREMMPARMRPDFAVTIAAVISSMAFGGAHAGNPNSSPIAVAFVAFAGLFLVLGQIVQGDLAIAIGAHFGWNFFQNALGMQVSGQTWLAEGALLVREELGPDVATGGAFGPEAGLEGLGAMVLGIALTLAWLRARTGALRVHASLARGSIATHVARN